LALRHAASFADHGHALEREGGVSWGLGQFDFLFLVSSAVSVPLLTKEGDFAHRFNAGSASNRHAGESRHPDFMLVALRLDSGFSPE
jgi:hypothetical protein